MKNLCVSVVLVSLVQTPCTNALLQKYALCSTDATGTASRNIRKVWTEWRAPTFLVAPDPAVPTSDSPLRRRFLLATLQLANPVVSLTSGPHASHAWFPSRDRMQYEYCLVNFLRVQNWAESVSSRLPVVATNNYNDNNNKQQQQLATYIEARLGAKGILTGAVTASDRTRTLATLKLSDCLNDLKYYAPSTATTIDDWREAMASLVEFDGYDSLVDASPRTALIVQQYTSEKANYVSRVLQQQLVPLGRRIVAGCNAAAVQTARHYVTDYYPNEVPRQISKT
jgi:hypothetical protein